MGTKNYNNYSDMITFSRASSGTALAKISGGGNLLSGDSSTFTGGFGDWAYYNGGTATVTNGAFTYSAGGSTTYQIAGFLTVGKAYKITYDFTRTVDTYGLTVGDRLGAATQVRTPLGNGQLSGTITGYIICGFTAAIIGVYANSGGSGTIDNVIIEEVLYDQPDGTLQLFNHPANKPRVEYDYQGNRLGLLVEEARTNYLKYSNEFETSPWELLNLGTSTAPVLTPNYAVSPEGQTNAYRLQGSINGTSLGDYSVLHQNTSGTGGFPTASIWIKSNTSQNQSLYFRGGAREITVTATQEWQRVSVSETTNSWQYYTIGLRGSFTGVSSMDILIYGGQLEAGTFPTSYIPTSGATATRAADVASIGVGAFGYNKTAGTVLVEFETPDLVQANALDIGSLDGANRIFVRNGQAFMWTDSATNVDITFATQTKGQKISFAFTANDAVVSADGIIQGTDTSVILPTSIDRLAIGSNSTTLSSQILNGHISSIAYYPRRLTDAQIKALTSPPETPTLSLTFDDSTTSYLETSIHG